MNQFEPVKCGKRRNPLLECNSVRHLTAGVTILFTMGLVGTVIIPNAMGAPVRGKDYGVSQQRASQRQYSDTRTLLASRFLTPDDAAVQDINYNDAINDIDNLIDDINDGLDEMGDDINNILNNHNDLRDALDAMSNAYAAHDQDAFNAASNAFDDLVNDIDAEDTINEIDDLMNEMADLNDDTDMQNQFNEDLATSLLGTDGNLFAPSGPSPGPSIGW